MRRSGSASAALLQLICCAAVLRVGSSEDFTAAILMPVDDNGFLGDNMIAAMLLAFEENKAELAASVGLSDRFAYSMTKGALRAMTFSVAKDYIDAGIRCDCISPARVHTPFVDNYLNDNYPDNSEEMFHKLAKSQPIGRMGTPEEIAGLVAYLCSSEASFITGSDVPIDGGFMTLNT